MIPGFNTDIRYDSEVFHVQTEDKGLKNPKVETLVYHGGTILHARRTSYSEVAEMECVRDVVKKLMQEQHQRVIHDIRAGKFKRSEPGPDTRNREKTLDELIVEYLAASHAQKGKGRP